MPDNLARFSLYKRRNQIYSIGYYRHGRRHWKSTGVTTRPEALKAMTRFQELLNERLRCVMLEQFIRDFLAFASSNHSAKTHELYERCPDRFLRLAGNIALKEVTAEYTGSKDKKLKAISPVTVNIKLRSLRSAFNTA